MQLNNGIEKPMIFVSHILSDQATRWGTMERWKSMLLFVVSSNLFCIYFGKAFNSATLYIYQILLFQNWCVEESLFQEYRLLIE